ncbi:Anthranilate synthase alpha subunit 2, chloroplastic [Galdieria sulphuraria]|uniref:anthranilate synthase n=1 Tax=Galdieria sulphuraria TaxID=130081 RepID=M2Y5P0_GALSU|nr:anthranilate synthase component I [Galdieria sulphuraria]EME31169.1 anthranilate synthase component I [Galdieria sulphuraria]GJD12360.1 Anthranilate synthase alpha subunit 2, chloroplastic [Galdieria sulphuraria]|eukprot:XP_005707689.1 anthranilate synthase component I [Galdieria sulphuraria]
MFFISSLFHWKRREESSCVTLAKDTRSYNTCFVVLRFTKKNCLSQTNTVRPTFRTSFKAFLRETLKCQNTDKNSRQFLVETSFEQFSSLAKEANLVPVFTRLFSDHLTPVSAFRCFISEQETQVPCFLLESVTGGENVGRFSFLGLQPRFLFLAKQHEIQYIEYSSSGTSKRTVVDERRYSAEDPTLELRKIAQKISTASDEQLPLESALSGGWVGYFSYDTMRYTSPKKLPFSSAPKDDRNLPDICMGQYREVIAFDNVNKLVYVVVWEDWKEHKSLRDAYENAVSNLQRLSETISNGILRSPLSSAVMDINTRLRGPKNSVSNMSKEYFLESIDKIHKHILDGNSFQTVFSQRFRRKTEAHPFSIYRALRVVNPSPYMIYMQCPSCILVASSPEILCKVTNRMMINRPLAGTRHRGVTEDEDAELEKELLGDEKDCAEHVMLVDLGRNDVGKVCKYGTVKVPKLMEIEKYSHVMHISSTVTGILCDEYASWDALQSALPAGTVSGAPKVRSMQIIDSLEPTMRGPYGGGIGYITFQDNMNMALALRTIVIPFQSSRGPDEEGLWTVDIQAGAGIVADSVPELEYQETENKAAALEVAVDVAERLFSSHFKPKLSSNEIAFHA